MLIDDRILAHQSTAAGALQVLAQAADVQWPDGSTARLHLVQGRGRVMVTHRALLRCGGHMQLIDLARLPHYGRRLDADLRTTLARDAEGLLFYTLRQVYPSASLFVAEVERHAAGTWWPVHPGFVWQPAARQVQADVLAEAQHAVGSVPAVLPQGTWMVAA